MKGKVKTMKATNINNIIKEIKEYQAMQEALKAEIEALKADAVEYLKANREVISNRFDSTSFKKDFADVYAEYSRKTSCMKFTCK